jgi:hypothetical protein
MLLAIYLPFLNGMLGTSPLQNSAWIIIVGVALANIFMIEIVKAYFARRIK